MPPERSQYGRPRTHCDTPSRDDQPLTLHPPPNPLSEDDAAESLNTSISTDTNAHTCHPTNELRDF
ncbi:hypothetical protein Pan14r_02720 [Crateriforma conspicua]|uniref:Uncharacterized protein n=1 Tax=Crateriforma conspicua TaxID=2527996 RepID=A0A5C5XYS0_9PLAN|nr:hypothetical protein Pan14r_02720 [Crateriforma conspicua]